MAGDRFFYLLGVDAGPGKAVQWLLDHYQPETVPSQENSLVTIGLGNSSQDLSMLEKMTIPVVIPSQTEINPSLADKGWKTAKFPGAQGWVEAITELCQV